MIRTMNLHKIYRTGDVQTVALSAVNLVINESEFIAIMGPSGCGKSTLLHILGLIDRPTSGEYYFLGQAVSSFGDKACAKFRRGNFGFIFQNFNLLDELTVYENIELPLIYQKVHAPERKRRVLQIMEQMHLVPSGNHFPTQLSGGLQQRTAVARALVGKPRVVLADEPTGNLDSVNGHEVMRLLAKLHEDGTTIVLVTHSIAYADYCHRIIHLFDGHIVSEHYPARSEQS